MVFHKNKHVIIDKKNEGKHMNNNRFLFRCAITLFVITGLVFAGPVSINTPAKAANVTTQQDEYKNEIADYIEKTLNEQLIARFSGSDGTKAGVAAPTKAGFRSSLVFKLDIAKLNGFTVHILLDYVSEAITNNPNLCTLSTDIVTEPSNNGKSITLYINSVIPGDEHLQAIRGYKSFLADLEQVPKSTDMSEYETLLYLHDKLVQQADYAEDLTDLSIYIPYTMSTTGVTVCQSYSAVFNQLVRDLGFTAYAMASSSHGWNAVKTSAGWTYVDPTWDDPSNQDRDTVFHRYLMVPESSFNGGHSLDVFYISRFPGINSRLASVDFFPKTGDISTAMNYLNGVWFCSYRGSVYRWDGHSSLPTVESSIPRDNNRCVGVINNTLYIGGSDGVSTYDPNSHVLTSQGSTPVSGFNYFNKALYYKSGSTWTRFIEKNTPDVAYTDLNGDKNSEVIDLPVPTKPTIKAKKTSAKSIRVSVTKRSNNAAGGYQVQFSTSKSFKSGVKKITVNGTSASKAGLSSHKTYYVRARGIWKAGGHIYTKYGAWSAVKKVKL